MIRTATQPSPAAQRISAYITKSYDKSGDGLLTADEFKGSADTFKRLDANGNGFVDASELTRGIAQVDADRQVSFARIVERRESLEGAEKFAPIGISGMIGGVGGFIAGCVLESPVVLAVSGAGLLGGFGLMCWALAKGRGKGDFGYGFFGKDKFGPMLDSFFKAN